MHIAIDMRSALDSKGGIPAYTKHIVRELIRIPSTHTFYLFTNSFLPQNLFDTTLRSSRVRSISCRIPNKLLASSLYVTKRPSLDSLVEKKIGAALDAWFVPNLNFFSYSSRCPYVITAHDISFAHFPRFYTQKMNWWHRIVRPGSLFTNAAKIIAVSSHTRDDVCREYQVDSKKISVIYHGLDPVFETKPQKTQKEWNFPKNYILVSGASSKRKNLMNTLEAFTEAKKRNEGLSDMKIIVTGVGQKTRSSDIRFVGFVSPETYHALMYYANALVYPSFYEGFGLPMIEAFAAGTPVIASINSSMSEIGSDAFYPVDPYDVQSLASAIAKVCTQIDFADYLRVHGRKRVEQFSWQRAAAQTLQILESLQK